MPKEPDRSGTIETIASRDAGAGFADELRALLRATFGPAFTDEDEAHGWGGHHVIVRNGSRLVAHAAVVPRNLRIGDRTVVAGYVENVATAPDQQGSGVGTRVMRRVNELIVASFDMGALSTGAHGFYQRLGWEAWSGPTYVCTGVMDVRTEEDDDAIMVLRCAATAEVDLHEPLTCETRPGDVW